LKFARKKKGLVHRSDGEVPVRVPGKEDFFPPLTEKKKKRDGGR